MGLKEYFKSLEEAGDAAIKAADDAIEDAQIATDTFFGKLRHWFWEILGL